MPVQVGKAITSVGGQCLLQTLDRLQVIFIE